MRICMKIKKKTYSILIILLVISIIMPVFYNVINAKITTNIPKNELKYDANDNSSVFPDSYKQYIQKLKQEHPNWQFKALYTNLDWTFSINQESYDTNYSISTVPDNLSNMYKKDSKNIYSDGNFVIASKYAVAYYMDPRNFLNDNYIMQFLALDYSNSVDYTDAIGKILSSTKMSGDLYNKYKRNGEIVELENGQTWVSLINNIAKNVGGNGINPVYLASKIRQETSGDIIDNGSINGSSDAYPGVYNFLNINSKPSKGSTNDSVTNGLIYAQKQGWTTPELSIKAGAYNCWSDYIQYAQNTLYFQKFDVSNQYNNAKELFGFQFMTNLLDPSSQAKSMYASYRNAGLLDANLVFYIPVYNNMPNDNATNPDDLNGFGEQTSANVSFNGDVNTNHSNNIISVSYGTNVSYIKEHTIATTDKEVTDFNGGTLNDSDKLRTGDILKIANNNQYLIAVIGDVNGDAKLTSSDYVLIKNYIMKNNPLSAVQVVAADLNNDSKLSSGDYVLVKKYIMNNN